MRRMVACLIALVLALSAGADAIGSATANRTCRMSCATGPDCCCSAKKSRRSTDEPEIAAEIAGCREQCAALQAFSKMDSGTSPSLEGMAVPVLRLTLSSREDLTPPPLPIGGAGPRAPPTTP